MKIRIPKNKSNFILILSSTTILLPLFIFLKPHSITKTYSFSVNKSLTLNTNELPFDIYRNGEKLRLKRTCSGLSGKSYARKCIDNRIVVVEERNILCNFSKKWCGGCSDIIEV